MRSADNRSRWRGVRDWWPHAEQSRFETVGDIDWHYQRFGSGPTLLLIHGAAASSHSWAAVAPLLSRWFDVVCVDLPGHGFSSAPGEFDIDQTSRYLEALLHALNIDTCVPVGHSAGAVLASQLVISGRTCTPRLVVINGALFPLSGMAGLTFRPLARVLNAVPAMHGFLTRRFADQAQVEQLISRMGSTPDPLSARCYQTLLSDPGHVRSVVSQMSAWDLGSIVRQYVDIRIPTLVMAGSEDMLVAPTQSRRFAAMLAHADFSLVRGQGHLLHEEAPTEVAERLLRWMD